MRISGLALSLLFVSTMSAQVPAPNESGISMGHLHLNAADPDAARKFWIEVIGGKPAKLGTVDVVVIPGALIMVNKREPSGPSEGTTVNHVGVRVKDMAGILAKAEAANIPIQTRNDKQAMLLTPGGTRLELTADPAMTVPVANHHIHFYTEDVEATRKWYADTFGAIPGKRASFLAADLPGVNLSFSKADAHLPGTKGRGLDHIGFEVKNLEAFTKKLEQSGVKFDVPYRTIPQLGVALAFFTDPWGTYIELTEGLNKVQ